jgi:hypothetical protein
LILLDTNVLSELVKPWPDPRVVTWTRHSAAGLAIPTIAVAKKVPDTFSPRGRKRFQTPFLPDTFFPEGVAGAAFEVEPVELEVPERADHPTLSSLR